MSTENNVPISEGRQSKQLIDDYLQKLRDKHQDTITKADLALDSFGDVVRSAPVKVAKPDILAALVNGGFHKAIDAKSRRNPSGCDMAVDDQEVQGLTYDICYGDLRTLIFRQPFHETNAYSPKAFVL